MNIRIFLNKIILVSAAIFWAGCSNDSTTNAADSKSSTIGDSSSSNSLKYLKCSPAEYMEPIDYRDEKYKEDPKEAAEADANRRAQRDIRDSAILRIFPDENNPSFRELQDIPRSTPFCHFKMATLAQASAPLYGAPFDDQLLKTIMCPDGIHFSDEYLEYEEDLKAHEKEVKAYEEQKAAYTEAYDKYFEEYYNKRFAELKSLLDSCDNHPEDFKPGNEEEYMFYCNSLDSLGYYECKYLQEEEEINSSSKASNSSKQAKSSSSSKKTEEKSSSSATYGGEFAKKSIL